MYPEEVPTKTLYPGQVGYIACNMKQSSEGNIPWLSLRRRVKDSSFFSAHIGDTIHRVGEVVEPMAGFQPAKAMVSFHPTKSPPNCVHLDFYRSLLEYIPSTAATSQSSRNLSIGYRLSYF
jgi:translation elongation factor EF-4